jgi:hypothetical protein
VLGTLQANSALGQAVANVQEVPLALDRFSGGRLLVHDGFHIGGHSEDSVEPEKGVVGLEENILFVVLALKNLLLPLSDQAASDG